MTTRFSTNFQSHRRAWPAPGSGISIRTGTGRLAAIFGLYKRRVGEVHPARMRSLSEPLRQVLRQTLATLGQRCPQDIDAAAQNAFSRLFAGSAEREEGTNSHPHLFDG
jgi:hypothetical protein